MLDSAFSSIIHELFSVVPPSSLYDEGVDASNTFITSDGAEYLLEDIKIGFFKSGHSLGLSVVPEYGFYIESNGEKLLFPTDVRDYSFIYPKFEDVRILFAHLWLGKGQALNLYDNEYIDKFCEFVKGFGAEKNYIAHLYDVHRTIDEMWSNMHYEHIKDSLDNARIFDLLDVIEL